MLNNEQKKFFGQNGYLVVENVVPQETLDKVRQEYSELMDGLYDKWFQEGKLSKNPEGMSFYQKLEVAYTEGCDWFQSMDISLPADKIEPDTPMHFGPAVFGMITNDKLLDVVECLIGGEITSNPIQHVRIKPPAKKLQQDEVRAHISSTDWHQDRGVTLEEADNTEMITVWVAVNDATPQNGCLQVIPKNEVGDMKPHCPAKKQLAIADGYIDTTKAIPLPVKSGGVVIFDPLTPHASLVNETDGFRWSFDLRYNVTGQPTGRSHFPHFIARSKKQPDMVLRNPEKWREAWELAREGLAQGPHINIHRWPEDAPVCA